MPSDFVEGAAVRKFMYFLVLLAVAFAAAYLFGPRVKADMTIAFDAASIGSDPEAYLATAESKVDGIREGLQKEIVWAFPASKAKTPIAIVYVHGFSASKNEVRPVPDKVAQALGANLYFTRLKGHGQDGPAMGTASVNDWVQDMAESVAIGKMLGEKVIIVSTSMGGGLATWAANNSTLSKDIAGLVFISPNYGVQAGGSFLLTAPFGEQLANLIVGKEREFIPENEMHGKWWTPKYPTKSVLPMAALTEVAAKVPVETIKIPALFIYSDGDKVVQPPLIKARAERWGTPATIYVLPKNDDPYSHVIAGDALSPSTTQEVTDKILEWVKASGL
jgi:alpha-beta hydrolase superfamily lysophospholipase